MNLHIGRLQLQVLRSCLSAPLTHVTASLRPEWFANGSTAASGAHIPLQGGHWRVGASVGRFELAAYWEVAR